jgi:mannose-1-phosphate guanylyltransferase
MYDPSKVIAVILAGGRGERFWPRSRRATPKQMLNITGDRPLVTETWTRIAGIIPPERILLICDPRLSTTLVRALPQLPPDNIVVEPEGRNTAAAVALAAMTVKQRWGDDALMMVLPSDHYIENSEAFVQTVKVALEVAAQGKDLVAIGLRPTRPETGYGYIEIPADHSDIMGQRIFRAIRFTEKPGAHEAMGFLRGGIHLWNSGMFFWRTDVIWDALGKNFPESVAALTDLPVNGEGRSKQLKANYGGIPKLPIDKAVMEKASNISVVEAFFPWDDMGCWESLERIKLPDEENNIVTSGEHVGVETHNCIISSTGPLVATIGVYDLVIVVENDAVLVMPKGRGEEVRKVIARISEMPEHKNLL